MLNPPDPEFFAQQVFDIVKTTPQGRVTTYGIVARLIPTPEGISQEDHSRLGPRWVGNAMRYYPPDLPWQRAINAKGKRSPRRGATQLCKLLENEGVVCKENDIVDLTAYGWPEDNDDHQLRLLRAIRCSLHLSV